MPPRKKRPAGSKAAKRTTGTARGASTPRRAVFVPPSFDAPPSSSPVNGRSIPVPNRVYVPPTFAEARPVGAGLDVEMIREYAAERDRTGFNERGVCRYGCDGMLSIIGRVRPPVAMHDLFCEYWNTSEGIKDMQALERQRD